MERVTYRLKKRKKKQDLKKQEIMSKLSFSP